ncbi:hypothetical protein TOPH_08726 [Tolypocladium ophioglossoides CBS 100239]|uniref:Uncharacterized protein n=1 Tax=Tolypocladium ophioglossoides (strain CBS 100239) TaxID=1163406 RepID=A0A0L0MXW2_TOLOC|nr:hypothetical protein TOPH_08726 [Tolypocladium ophioglossoides CBS 100239]
MMVISPESRSSARDCYELAALLPRAAEGGCTTPRPAPYAGSEEQTTFRYGPDGHDVDGQDTTVQLPRAYADGYTTASYEGEFVRSEAPPPDTVAPVSKKTRKRTTVFKAPSLSLSSSARRPIKRREGRSRRSGSVSDRHPEELAHFLEDYSSDPFDPLYVGSSLASWVGERKSGSCADQSSHSSTMQHQLEDADEQIDCGPGLVPPPNISSIPRSPWEGWCLEDEEPATGISDGVSPSHLETDERSMAALLLQAMGQEFRQ